MKVFLNPINSNFGRNFIGKLEILPCSIDSDDGSVKIKFSSDSLDLTIDTNYLFGAYLICVKDTVSEHYSHQSWKDRKKSSEKSSSLGPCLYLPSEAISSLEPKKFDFFSCFKNLFTHQKSSFHFETINFDTLSLFASTLENMFNFVETPENSQRFDLLLFGVRNPELKYGFSIRKDIIQVWRFSFVENDLDSSLGFLQKIRAAIFNSHLNGKITKEISYHRRKYFVLINPYGGTKKGPNIWKSVVQPIFDVSNLAYDVVFTQYAGHAADIGKSFDLSYDAIVFISGDGLVHEFLNGVMTRNDYKKALEIPFGIIPGGSGNALSKNVGSLSPEIAAISVIKYHHKPLDLFAFKQLARNDLPIKYGFLEVMWSLIADVDIESEKVRWAGSFRFTLWAIIRLFKLRKYKGKLFLKTKNINSKDDSGSLLSTINNINALKLVENWEFVDGPFTYFMGMNLPWCATDTLPAPKAKMNDGFIDTVWINDARRVEMLKLLLDTESGKYINLPFVNSKKCKAFLLLPREFYYGKSGGNETIDEFKSAEEASVSKNFRGILDIDGELIDYGPLYVEAIPSVANLIISKRFSEV